MCIIADSVKDISTTKIAVFHVGYVFQNQNQNPIPKPIPNPAQLVVYSAQVDSVVDKNAFILPIYNPSNQIENIIPLDMSKMPDFFSSVDQIFSKWFPKIMKQSFSMTNSYSFNESDSFLPVHKVGDYKFSIVPNKIDFNRIDRSHLNIDPTAKISIDMHSNDYSFIVYQFFQRGKIDISPFGYLCIPPTDNSMIVPTIHGHPHDHMPNINMGYVPNFYVNYKSDFEQTALYDHEIYAIVKCGPESKSSKINIQESDLQSINNLLKRINKDYQGRNIRIFGPRCFVPKKIEIKSTEINRNLFIDLTGSKFAHDLIIDQSG